MHWKYNPAGEPSSGAIDVIRAALAEISAASGVEMIEDGDTSIDVSDPNQADPQIAEGEVVIGFAPPGSPAIQPSEYYADKFVWGSAHVLSQGPDIGQGSVALNHETAMMLPLDFSSSASLGAVVLHETGHIVGLQHVAPSTQIMVAVAGHSHEHLGTGDLAGLATLKDRPCEN